MGLQIQRAARREESSRRRWYPQVSTGNIWQHLKLLAMQPSQGPAHGSHFLQPGATCCPCPAAFMQRKGRKEERLPQCLSDFKIKITEFINAHVYIAIGRVEDHRTTQGLQSSPRLHPGLNIHWTAWASEGQGLVPGLDIISCVMSTWLPT